MPTPFDPGEGSQPTTPKPSQRGFHLPGRQPWARDNVRRSHEEALYAYGEYDLFVLMWSLEDFHANRVDRCSLCSVTTHLDPAVSERIFDAFKQPARAHCPNCYGTTFEGGWRAKIVRPCLWNDVSEEQQVNTNRGVVTKKTAQAIESTWDFYMRSGDYVMRADGTRWRVSNAQQTRLVTGFGYTARVDTQLGVNMATVVREDESSVAYEIPPETRTELTALLDVSGRHFPLARG
jgi:hypothetical protein